MADVASCTDQQDFLVPLAATVLAALCEHCSVWLEHCVVEWAATSPVSERMAHEHAVCLLTSLSGLQPFF